MRRDASKNSPLLEIASVVRACGYVASLIVHANHEVSTEPEEACEPLQPATAGQRADLRRRDARPERISHTGQSIDDDRLPHEQTDCGLKDDEVRGPADQSKGHNQRRRRRRRMRPIQENHQRSGRGQGQRRGQDPGPA